MRKICRFFHSWQVELNLFGGDNIYGLSRGVVGGVGCGVKVHPNGSTSLAYTRPGQYFLVTGFESDEKSQIPWSSALSYEQKKIYMYKKREKETG